jgi:uncharacterized membrane protein
MNHHYLIYCHLLPTGHSTGSPLAVLQSLFSLPSLLVRVTLQLTVSQSVCLGVEPRLGLMTRYLFIFRESYISRYKRTRRNIDAARTAHKTYFYCCVAQTTQKTALILLSDADHIETLERVHGAVAW